MSNQTSKYKSYNNDQYEEHFSGFLIESWSYSKVTTFARNEKVFEMQYVYGEKSKMGPSAIAGNAYHAAMEANFKALQTGEELSVVDLEAEAFAEIEETGANAMRLGKTTPSVEEFKQTVIKHSVQLVANFLKEAGIYMDDVAEILDIEVYCNEWVVVNGVDIPLPIHAKIDLVLKLKNGKVVIVDHKSVGIFSDEVDIALIRGQQAIAYVCAYESKTGLTVNEVWFIENKYSKNRDGGPQLNKFIIEVTEDNRKLYESMLYEPLRRMVQAVQDEDYVFLINPHDNMQDPAEIFDFWCKTMIAEVGEFDIQPKKRGLIEKRQRKIRDASVATINPKVIKQFKQKASDFIRYDISSKDMTNEEKITHVLKTFGAFVQVAHVIEGYSSNSYLLEVSGGTKVSSISSHKLDIASALNKPTVRIGNALTVYQGRSYLPVEVSKKRERVLDWTPADLKDSKLPIGRDNFGQLVYWDLNNPSTTNALICGAAGSGKSVLVKTIIEYALLAGYDVLILDPKYEFVDYSSRSRVKVVNEISSIEYEAAYLVEEMNENIRDGRKIKKLVIAEEFADAVAAGRKGKALNGDKSLEENIRMLTQKGRSTGYRVCAATQRASTKVITGDAKVNFQVLVCFKVPKEVDSYVVLDEGGAEALGGQGDGLIKSPEFEEVIRFQGYYLP